MPKVGALSGGISGKHARMTGDALWSCGYEAWPSAMKRGRTLTPCGAEFSAAVGEEMRKRGEDAGSVAKLLSLRQS